MDEKSKAQPRDKGTTSPTPDVVLAPDSDAPDEHPSSTVARASTSMAKGSPTRYDAVAANDGAEGAHPHDHDEDEQRHQLRPGHSEMYATPGGSYSNSSDINVAPQPTQYDVSSGPRYPMAANGANLAPSGSGARFSRPASRTSMLTTAETFRTASPSFDRRPSITPQMSAVPMQYRPTSPVMFEEPPLPGRFNTASPSLAVNYLPGKFSTKVFQHDRSQSPAHGGIFASRSASRLRPPSGLGKHASGSGQSSDAEDAEQQYSRAQQRLGAVTPFTTAVQRAAASNPAQAPRLRHSIKRGAGRKAWGPDGGGNAVVGAGDYEDDDGVDLTRSTSQRRKLRQRQSAEQGNEAGFAPGEADRRRTSMLHSNLGHFTEIEDSEAEDSDADQSGPEEATPPRGADAQAGPQRRKSQRTRQMRKEERSHPEHRPDTGRQPGLTGLLTGSRVAYLLGFRDNDSAYDIHPEDDDERYADTTELQRNRFVMSMSRLGGADNKRGKRRAKWNPFKWAMVLANFVLTIYAIAALIGTLFTWANVWENAATVQVGNRDELILGTVAAGLCFIAAVIGWCGILLNNRSFLSIYVTILWIAFIFIMAPGYITYKRRSFNLEGKLNQQWSRRLSVAGRLVIQDELSCCGYYSPYVLASASGRCYARSIQPGCKGRYLRFQRRALQNFYLAAFGIVGPHLLVITVALLCSNNITYRFGKGLTPREYRLDETTAELIKEQLLKQAAENSPHALHGEHGEDLQPHPGYPRKKDSFALSEKSLMPDEGNSSNSAHHTDKTLNSQPRRPSAMANNAGDAKVAESHELKDLSQHRNDSTPPEMHVVVPLLPSRAQGQLQPPEPMSSAASTNSNSSNVSQVGPRTS